MPGPSLQDAQQIYSNAGLRTQYGLVLPPGARVAAFVRSTGVQSGDDAFLATNLVTTLAAGLARVRPGLGDFVVCLPGHSELVDAAATAAFAANLVAGTKIIGVGRGSNAPTFTWAVVGASWAVGVNDVLIAGLRLQTAGIFTTLSVNTTLAITTSANDFGFFQNEVETGTLTANAVTVLSVTGAASRFDICGNTFRGQLNGGANTVLVSTTGGDGRICDNEIIASATSATGNINVTSTASRIKILRNVINNLTTASVAGIGFANAASTGQCAYNTITVLSTGAAVSGTTGIAIGAACVVGFFQNFIVNDPLKSGLLMPTADT